ncbi:MAG: sulfatase-like hydrolase/transferase [Akkermansia sp.]|nr:sulfatase-like hydrolase/transferase [Akkermansia sp.]
MNKVIYRICAFLLAAYVYCAALDAFFFDYPGWVLLFRQVYGVLLAAGVVYVCVRLKWLGVAMYIVSSLLFAVLHYSYVALGYSAGFEFVSAVFQTNVDELSGFVSLSSILAFAGGAVALTGVYALAVYSLKWKKLSLKECLLVLGVMVAWMGVYEIPALTIGKRYGFYRKMADNTLRNDREMFITGHSDVAVNRWCSPYSNVKQLRGGVKEYFREIDVTESASFASQDKRVNDDLVFVFVIGESVRADHVPAGGYHRNTLPRLSKESGVCFFTRMYSYASSTYDSVAAMLSGMLKQGDVPQVTSYAGILKHHGFEGRLYSENTMNITDSKRFSVLLGQYMKSCTSCRGPIEDISARIVREIDSCGANRQFVVIENGTGHFPYINEDKYDVYHPCNTNWFVPAPDNKRELLVNDYDNCLNSVDAFLSAIIDGVRHRNAVMLYVSDHGQLLYDNGKLMHGDPGNPILRRPAAFVWFSDEYKRRYPEVVADMESVRDKPLVHGQVYATVLKLAGIESTVPLQIGDFVEDDVRNHAHNVPEHLLSE